MKKGKSSSRRKPVPLSESLEKRLSVYALAAGAAGVSMLALAPAAKADIVYQDVNISLTQGTTQYLNINGVNELAFDNSLFQRTRNRSCGPFGGSCILFSHTQGTLFMKSVSGGAEVMANLDSVGRLAPQRLGAGAAIGQSANNFAKASNLILATHFRIRTASYHYFGITTIKGRSNVSGEWADRNGYLGFKFFEGSKSYFGWAHLSVHATAENISGKLLSFAYNTCGGQSIEAGQTTGTPCSEPTSTPVPEPPTLALLALGAVGLFALRKKRQAAAERESVAKG